MWKIFLTPDQNVFFQVEHPKIKEKYESGVFGSWRQKFIGRNNFNLSLFLQSDGVLKFISKMLFQVTRFRNLFRLNFVVR